MINSAARSQLSGKKWYRNISAGNPLYSEMELIATTIITGTGVSQVDFASITTDYKHLQLRVVMRDASSGTDIVEKIGFNNSLTAVYDTHNLQGTGSSVISNNVLNQDTIWSWRSPGSTSTANVFSAAIVDILDYASTSKNKTVRSFYGFDGGTNEVALRSGAWRNTSAITSVKIYTGGLAIGSRLSLYGIKG